MPYLLLSAYLLIRVASSVTVKKNSREFSSLGLIGTLIYVFETGVFSLFFFYALNGFTLNINLTLTLFAAIYGAVVLLNLVPTMFMYNYGTITLVNFVSNTVLIISSTVVGVTLFSESFSYSTLLRITLMLLCVLTVYLGAQKNLPESESVKKRRSVHPLAIILPSVTALMALTTTVIIKLHNNHPDYTDTTSLYFMTNVFCIIYTVPIIAMIARKSGIGARGVAKMIINKRTVGSLINTAIGAVLSITTAALLSSMDVAVYTPVTSALGFIALAIATPIVREKLDRYTVLATVLSILSIILPHLIFS